MIDGIDQFLDDSLDALREFVDNTKHDLLHWMADDICVSIAGGGKLLIVGNGGSAADAQHIAAEYVVRFGHDRDPISAIALTADTAIITACANDFAFNTIFARQVAALGRRGDVLLGISTSGMSENVINALATARARGIVTHGFTSDRGAGFIMEGLCDRLLVAPTGDTAIAQQIHMVAAHAICGMVERRVRL